MKYYIYNIYTMHQHHLTLAHPFFYVSTSKTNLTIAGSPILCLSYTNPSFMWSRPFSPKNPKNRCGNPVYASPKTGERPYKHQHFYPLFFLNNFPSKLLPYNTQANSITKEILNLYMSHYYLIFICFVYLIVTI
jgi:hypothetical protein